VNWTKGANAAKLRLRELTLPVLVANGIDDVMVPAENSFIIARGAPDAKLVLYPRSGHAFLFQYAEVFADEVERFLEA
jgi:pimeloyl-ACP methyl ester carboxylesterase